MTRVKIDLFQKLGWRAYCLALMVVVGIVWVAINNVGSEPPSWVIDILSPILGWSLIVSWISAIAHAIYRYLRK